MKKILLLLYLCTYFSYSQDKSSLQKHFTYKDILEWNQGMEFVTSKNSYSDRLYLYKGKIKGKEIDNNFFFDKILTFERIETYPKNKEKIEYVAVIFSLNNNEYAYKVTINNFQKFKDAKVLHYVPNLIYYNDYIKAKELLLNKKLYLKSNYYKIKSMEYFEEILITEVNLKTPEFPVSVKYIKNGSEYVLDLKLSGINSQYNYPCYDKCISEFNFNTMITSEEYIKLKEQEDNLRIKQQKEQDSLIFEKQKYNKLVLDNNWKSIKENCDYRKNIIDEFTNKKNKITYFYDLTSPSIYDYSEVAISLESDGADKYVKFRTKKELGCVTNSSYDTSYAKVKLENGIILTFNHMFDTDCEEFFLISKLTNQQIKHLKSSKIKSIRLQGSKYYEDFYNIVFNDFFMCKLKCID